MRYLTRWPGEQAEMLDLLQIIQRNCLCPDRGSGPARGVCSAHQLLIADQQAINRLAFARSIVDRLRAEEWSDGRGGSPNPLPASVD